MFLRPLPFRIDGLFIWLRGVIVFLPTIVILIRCGVHHFAFHIGFYNCSFGNYNSGGVSGCWSFFLFKVGLWSYNFFACCWGGLGGSSFTIFFVFIIWVFIIVAFIAFCSFWIIFILVGVLRLGGIGSGSVAVGAVMFTIIECSAMIRND